MGNPKEKAKIAAKRAQQIATIDSEKMNVPIKKPHSFHLLLILHSILMASLTYIIYSIIFTEKTSESDTFKYFKTFQIYHSTGNLVKFVLAYIFVALFSWIISDFHTYFKNTKKITEMKKTCDKIKSSKVKVYFDIVCYNNQKKGKEKQKIITHSKVKYVELSQCYDQSGFLKPEVQKQFKFPYVLVNYKVDFEFIEKKQQKILDSMYKQFVQSNKRDTHQDYKKVIKLEKYYSSEQTKQAYLMKGEQHNEQHNLFLLLTICGLLLIAWPVAMIIEFNFVERYQINCIKKIKLNEDQQGYKDVTQ